MTDATYIDEYGNKYIRKNVNLKLFGLSVAERYFPVATDEPKSFYIKTILGGWFGLHKFMSKDYLQGFLYLISNGGFGIFYVMDVISMAMGSYYIVQKELNTDRGIPYASYVKKRIYLDRLDSVYLSVCGSCLSILIAFLTYRFIYINLLSFLGIGISQILLEIAKEVF